jgi:hypothetical protein
MEPEAAAALRDLYARTVDDARQALAECIATEARAHDELAEAMRAIGRQTECVMAGAGDDRAVEAFAGWLRRNRETVAAAEARASHAVAETTIARAALRLAEQASAGNAALLAGR